MVILNLAQSIDPDYNYGPWLDTWIFDGSFVPR